MRDTRLFCYRLRSDVDYDSEIVWSYVQRTGGHISIRADSIDFWVTPPAELFLVCAWPLLERRRDQDYV